MRNIHPKTLVIPSMILLTLFLSLLSNSIADSHSPSLTIDLSPNLDQINTIKTVNNLSKKYPDSIQKWKSEIEQSARKYSLDPNLIAAVMLQESGGQPSVISSSGAVGLMQIMPNDGIASGFLCGAEPCFKQRPFTQELLDPAFNIEYGARMLSSLQNRTGSLRESLKAYGPMDVGFYYADLVISVYSSST